jgi:glycerol-3-phosphate O-acyltransferase
MNRINRATPATATSVVCVAMLAADRAVTLDEVLETIAPLADYIRCRNWSVAGAVDLTDPHQVRTTLHELSASGVLASFAGLQTIWGIAPGQHLIAAFYRNGMIHMLVMRAIAELTLLAVSERDRDSRASTALEEALQLREILKFEFFFPRRREFAQELRAELLMIDPDLAHGPDDVAPDVAGRWLRDAQPLVAHLALRPFLEAYAVVMHRLCALSDDTADGPFDEDGFLRECLTAGQQWVLQHRLASEESVSLEMFRTALRLARHRGLVESNDPDLRQRRLAFAARIHDLTRRVALIAQIKPTRSSPPQTGGQSSPVPA